MKYIKYNENYVNLELVKKIKVNQLDRAKLIIEMDQEQFNIIVPVYVAREKFRKDLIKKINYFIAAAEKEILDINTWVLDFENNLKAK